jgi:hypothetical protein
MKSLTRILIFITCLLLVVIGTNGQKLIKYSERPNGHNSPYRISIKEILKSPDAYEGTHLQVVGYLNLGFEGNVIFPNKNELKSKHAKGLWLDLTRRTMSQWRNYKNKYVIIDAVFDANNHGHMNAWGGTLKNITSIKIYTAGD